jgi:type IV fimbrial biogenesis protein FimT
VDLKGTDVFHGEIIRNLRGYSFIEVLVVVSIIGMVGAWGGVWLMEQLPQLRLNGAVRQIQGDLVKAKMQAARQGNKFRFQLLNAHRYAILDDDNNNGKEDRGERVTIKDLSKDFQGIILKTTNHPIFHPRGTASSLATITVDNGQTTKKISVSITGRIRVQQIS